MRAFGMKMPGGAGKAENIIFNSAAEGSANARRWNSPALGSWSGTCLERDLQRRRSGSGGGSGRGAGGESGGSMMSGRCGGERGGRMMMSGGSRSGGSGGMSEGAPGGVCARRVRCISSLS